MEPGSGGGQAELSQPAGLGCRPVWCVVWFACRFGVIVVMCRIGGMDGFTCCM